MPGTEGFGVSEVQTGLGALLADDFGQLAGRRVGLITNHTGIDRSLRYDIDLMHESRRLNLVALFGPEHGVRGAAQAGVKVGSGIDEHTGLPVFSLYGETQRPTPAMLNGIDTLVFDIQEVGVRFATYQATMVYCLEAAAAAGIDFVVLDRPNPITGTHVAGNLLKPDFSSFVGPRQTPIRHGMTAGELARMFAAESGVLEPVVVPMRGWRRELWFDQTGLPWVLPSPNLPTLDSATLYPGTCLIEGCNVSEGRGTTRPFEYIGAPWLDPFRFANELESRGLPGVAFRPSYFTPTFSKYAGEVCGGVQIYVTDRNVLKPVQVGIHLLHACLTLEPSSFAWRYRDNGTAVIDLLLGSDSPRNDLDAGQSPAQVMAGWDLDMESFRQRRKPFLLYPE
jgi:uncharacterized protein YbbC (DUF1343 family)